MARPSVGRPAWDLHWETHNLLSVSPLATTALHNARNSTAEYTLLGHFDTLIKCQQTIQATRVDLPSLSFTYIFPSHRKPALRGACFRIWSHRWEPAITGDTVSGRLLCTATQEYVQLQTTLCPAASELDNERPRDSDGAIIMLSAGGTRSVSAARTAAADLRNLIEHDSNAVASDILAFHDGSISPVERQELWSEFPRLRAVLLTRELWRPPLEMSMAERYFKQGYTDTLGPRDTARWLGFRFWSVLVFPEARRRGYDWVLRLGRGSRMRSKAPDIFAMMKGRDAAYGYRLMGCELVRRADFFRLIQRTLLLQKVQPHWLLDGCSRRAGLLDYHRENCASNGMLPGAFQVLPGMACLPSSPVLRSSPLCSTGGFLCCQCDILHSAGRSKLLRPCC